MARTGTTRVRGGRPVGRYRLSARFIRWATRLLLLVMGVLVVAGFVLGFASDAMSDPDAGEAWSRVAIGLIAGGVGLPVLVAAILGGEAIMAGGGVVGFGLVAGVAAVIATRVAAVAAWLGPWRPWALWGGLGLAVVSGVGFWILGWVARVPMWFQAPMVGSPRVYVRGRSEQPGDRNLTRRRRRR